MPTMTRSWLPASEARARPSPPGGRYDPGFTLTELLIVLGLIAMLVSLLLPVVGRMRSTAAAVGCVANLRQMCTAWTMSVSESGGRLTDFVWNTPGNPDAAWNGYWTGAMDHGHVTGSSLLCPSASEPAPTDATRGYGTALHAWTGRYEDNGTAVKHDAIRYRRSSYGFNRYLTSIGGFGSNGGTYLAEVRNPANVPVFVDCVYAEVRPANGQPARPVEPPPHLRGDGLSVGAPQHWKFLIARHGRGVNVAFVDGSARWVRLEDTYTLNWKDDWTPYRLALPAK